MYERCGAARCRADGCDGWGGLVVQLPGRDTITRTIGSFVTYQTGWYRKMTHPDEAISV